MKFNKLISVPSIWLGKGYVNEDNSVIFLNPPSIQDSHPSDCDFISITKGLLERFTLSPNLESCNGHFGIFRADSYDNDTQIEELMRPGALLGNTENIWHFSFNFVEVSEYCDFLVTNKPLASELLQLISKNYATSRYKSAVISHYTNKSQKLRAFDVMESMDVYFNPYRRCLVVANSPQKDLLPFGSPKVVDSARYDVDLDWLEYAFKGAERIGNRLETDYSSLLSSLMPQVLESN
ncbi:TPA: hypothetical protein I7117_22460 [Vibrio vulnificus]|uniref:hypothetical protein n=1 Tax=Vibrio navarrensis TaxID=29495 RepID=UPI0018DBB3F2|nr:hypothetical protein [Vibrio navarrensis]MBH9739890.1 hypothetical protein [Vibrio navarrensis]HAS6102221.1 hypothetical protein [Vibrio vulnificus]